MRDAFAMLDLFGLSADCLSASPPASPPAASPQPAPQPSLLSAASPPAASLPASSPAASPLCEFSDRDLATVAKGFAALGTKAPGAPGSPGSPGILTGVFAVPAAAEAYAPPRIVREVCGQCGHDLAGCDYSSEQVCPGCGQVFEADTTGVSYETERAQADGATRLRLVGPNSAQYQPDLYRSYSGNNSATQLRTIIEEFKFYREQLFKVEGYAFPLDILEKAAQMYIEVQKEAVKRSANKRMIMAACVARACLESGVAANEKRISVMMQVAGYARGVNYLVKLGTDKRIEFAPADVHWPEVSTLFMTLGYTGPEYRFLQAAVLDVVTTAERHQIGTSSLLRSKVAGATFVVLSRCSDPALLPHRLPIAEFCRRGNIRRNTIDRFIFELSDYHDSFFAECYERAGLDAEARDDC